MVALTCAAVRTISVVVALSSLLQPQVFRSGVELVRIPISLAPADQRAAPTSSLGPADFSILEDGVRQEISLFERDHVPLRVCVLLDISHSMLTTSASKLALGAYGHVITLLAPSDEVSVVTFAMGTDVVMPWLPARRAVDHQLKLISEGGTAIVDAVRTGMRQIDKASPGRSLILVITDGGENASAAAINRNSRLQSRGNAGRIARHQSSDPRQPGREAETTADCRCAAAVGG